LLLNTLYYKFIMVEVFKTNVKKVQEATTLIDQLSLHFPGSKINFDLDDCDKILRIEGINFLAEKVMLLLKKNGFKCRLLE